MHHRIFILFRPLPISSAKTLQRDSARNSIRLVFIAMLPIWTVVTTAHNQDSWQWKSHTWGSLRRFCWHACHQAQFMENHACPSVTLAISFKEQQNRRNAANRLITVIKSSMTFERMSTYTNSSDSEKTELTENDLENKVKCDNDAKQRHIALHFAFFHAISSI